MEIKIQERLLNEKEIERTRFARWFRD